MRAMLSCVRLGECIFSLSIVVFRALARISAPRSARVQLFSRRKIGVDFDLAVELLFAGKRTSVFSTSRCLRGSQLQRCATKPVRASLRPGADSGINALQQVASYKAAPGRAPAASGPRAARLGSQSLAK